MRIFLLKISHLFIKTKNAIIFGIIAFLGFSMFPEKVAAQYGVPVAKFTFSGTVKSEKGKELLSNIKVSNRFDSTYTNEKGEFSFTSMAPPFARHKLLITDTSGKYARRDTFLRKKFKNLKFYLTEKVDN